MVNLTGKRFGRLVVLEKTKAHNKSSSFWKCLCDCGNITESSGQHLQNGHTKSCGCYRKELGFTLNKTHGMSKQNKTYKTWKLMRSRCNTPTDMHYKWYGGRGIKVSKEWDNFLVFLQDMGERPDGKTLDRINPDGDYCKSNCRWATPKEQARTNRGCFKKHTKGGS